MATSGSTNFSLNRDEIIKGSLGLLNVIDPGESVDATLIDDGSKDLNMMVKGWLLDGFQLYGLKRATLFLQTTKNSYNLGPTGDNATFSYTSTTIRVAAAAAATTLEVVTTAGMTAGDFIGITQDSGASHWTTIASVTDSDTVVITAGLAGAAAVGKKVYWYTSKIPRPIDVTQVFIKDTSGVDYTLTRMSKEQYWRVYDKDIPGQPTRFHYDPQLTNGIFYVNYLPNNVDETCELIVQRVYEDFDALTDNPDFPQEFYEVITYNLAIRLAPKYGVLPNQFLVGMAESLRVKAFGKYMNTYGCIQPTRF